MHQVSRSDRQSMMSRPRRQFHHRDSRPQRARRDRAAFPVAGSAVAALACILAAFVAFAPHDAIAQAPSAWETQTNDVPTAQPPANANTTVIPRSMPPQAGTQHRPPSAQPAKEDDGSGTLSLSAHLVTDGPRIDRGIVWRVYPAQAQGREAAKPLQTHTSANPTVRLPPGDYVVNAAFGRAHLTKRTSIETGQNTSEKFVINAGGLRIRALISEQEAPPKSVTYDILEGDINQSGSRPVVLANARPGLIIRLNAGIYHVVSTYGDANATVGADVSVEAGKLTEATISHAAAKVTFKLVDRPGGEALPGTRWTIATPKGDVIKRSVGALPTHILAPGPYLVTAVSNGRAFQQQFSVEDGQLVRVEVLMQ